MDAKELDAWAAEVWSEDPEVEFTDTPLDQNPPHGHNEERQLDKGVARIVPFLVSLKSRLFGGES